VSQYEKTIKLYEEAISDLDEQLPEAEDEQKTQHRQNVSKPLLNDFKDWLDKNTSKVPRPIRPFFTV